MKTTGADLLMRLLERQGIETIAGIPGGASLPLYDALRSSRIRHVLARHEQGAGFIAQGMARATGRPAVCFGTSGPGATNLLTAVADAKLDSIPIVAVTGQVPRAMIGTDAFQEIDTYGLTVPITKHNYLVRSAGELLEIVPEAFRIAQSGRPGPVVVDVPKDVQKEEIDVGSLPEPGRADPRPPIAEADVAAAAAMIAAARRPLILIGAGIIAAGAAELLRELAEKASIPVASTLLGLGALPSGHPLFLGMVGMHAARCTNLVLEECDLLIALGIRFDDRATGKVEAFCPGAKIIHVDIDASEIGKIKRPALGTEADVGDWLRALLPRLDASHREAGTKRTARSMREARAKRGPRARAETGSRTHAEAESRTRAETGSWTRAETGSRTHPEAASWTRPEAGPREAWLRRVASLRASHPLAMPGSDDPLQPYGAVCRTAALAGDGAIVTSDVGQHQMWAAQAFPFASPRQWLTSGGLGTMGFGLPAAIGAALACPGRRVVCFTGDGSLLMNLQELATAAEERVDVKIVLLNNGHLGLVRQQQQLFYGERYHASRFVAEPDFAAIARGFGVEAFDLGRAADPGDALERALSRPGPCLVNIPIAAAENVYPMVPPGAANRDMIDGGSHAERCARSA